MFTKEEILARTALKRAEAIEKGQAPEEAELNVAMTICGCAFYGKKQRSGEDFSEHALTVAAQHQSKSKRIISILHDVIEDTDWTLEDMRAAGFSERIITGLDGVTKREGEAYFDFIERCSLSGPDAIAVKLADLRHNSDPLRYRHITSKDTHVWKEKAYNVAYHYLVDILKTDEDEEAYYNERGRSIFEYMCSRKGYMEHPRMINQLMEQFSSRLERCAIPELSVRFSLNI